MKFKDAIIKVKQEYNIVDYIRSNGTQLKPSGPGRYIGLCPFHNEKTPSFSVNEDFQSYKCFGCGASGSVIDFAMYSHSTEFAPAVKLLAESKGIEIDSNSTKEDSVDLASLYRIVKSASEFYHHEFVQLSDSHPAKLEITKRGLPLDSDIYGYSPEAPNKLYNYLSALGYSDDLIKQTELVIFKEGRAPWDFFHGRLMITLSDFMGKPVSFTARKLFEDDKMPGKYVNGKDSPIFHKKSLLFGLDSAKKSAREKKSIIVAEGQFDVKALASIGLDNVCGTSGTAFTSDHGNALRRLVGDEGKITFVFDGDEAGIKAAISAFSNEPTLHMQSYAVQLERKKDPCDYVVSGESEELIKLIENPSPLYDFVIDVANKRLNVDKNGRMRFIQETVKLTKKAKDKFVVESMLSRISVLSATPIDQIRDLFNNIKSPTVREGNTVESAEEEKLSPKIRISESSQADTFMVRALSLMSLAPEIVIKNTPRKFPTKFQAFVGELIRNYKNYRSKELAWRFIPEEYDDKDFVILLQSQDFMGNPREDENALLRQYLFMYNKAIELYRVEAENIKKSRAMSSVIDSTSAKELAKAINLYTTNNK